MTAGVFQQMRISDGRYDVENSVFLAEFSKECINDTFVRRRFKRFMVVFGCFRIDSSIQPLLLISEMGRSLVNYGVIWALCWYRL